VKTLFRKLREEPVRVSLYSLVALTGTYLVDKQVIDAKDAAFAGGVAAIILAVEGLRGSVTPTAKQDAEAGETGDVN
jgi:hypothetical protein